TGVACVSTLSLALVGSGPLGLRSPVVGCLLGASAVAATAFALAERRARNPLVDLTILRSRVFSGGLLAQLLLGTAGNGVVFYTGLVLQEAVGLSPGETGMALLPIAAAAVVGTPLGPL